MNSSLSVLRLVRNVMILSLAFLTGCFEPPEPEPVGTRPHGEQAEPGVPSSSSHASGTSLSAGDETPTPTDLLPPDRFFVVEVSDGGFHQATGDLAIQELPEDVQRAVTLSFIGYKDGGDSFFGFGLQEHGEFQVLPAVFRNGARKLSLYEQVNARYPHESGHEVGRPVESMRMTSHGAGVFEFELALGSVNAADVRSDVTFAPTATVRVFGHLRPSCSVRPEGGDFVDETGERTLAPSLSDGRFTTSFCQEALSDLGLALDENGDLVLSTLGADMPLDITPPSRQP